MNGGVVTYEDPGGEGGGRAAEGEAGERDLGGCVLGLAERGAAAGALEGLAVEGDGGPEARRVVGALARAHVRRQAEAAPLRQLLELVLVHPYFLAVCLYSSYYSILHIPIYHSVVFLSFVGEIMAS